MNGPGDPSAEALFARWLQAYDDDPGASFDAVLDAHPEVAPQLRALYDAWRRQDAAPPTVEIEPGGMSSGAWAALVRRLSERRVNYRRYRFEGEIARGGMGVVHRVYDRDARRRLAMKVMIAPPESAEGAPRDGGDSTLGRFLEEAQVTSQLDHPGIVPIHEIGLDDEGRVYFTMKLVKGQDLRSIFERVADTTDVEWTTTRALSVMLKVCEAMAYAHAKGVIHRDLKPANVMVGRFGEAYVMDWGLARIRGREDAHDLRLRVEPLSSLQSERKDAEAATPDSPVLTMDGTVMGTPVYMPPEQATGHTERIGPTADVYAVGAMLYHLISGNMPYTDSGDRISPHTILAAVTQGPPRPLAERRPDAPPELVAVIEKAMARDIEDRYADMTELSRDLRAFLEHRVVSAFEAGPWAELKKWVRRNRAVAAVVLLAVLAVSGSTGLAVLFWEKAAANERQREAKEQNVRRLSDERRVVDLEARAEALWPAVPLLLPAIETWITEARSLLTNLPLHQSALAEVQAKGRRTSLPEVPDTEAEYDFGGDVEAEWWHGEMQELVQALHRLDADDRFGATIRSMTERRSAAVSVDRATISDSAVATRWESARAELRRHPAYGGLDLRPQFGLVPLEPDPVTGLWEFWHLPSGARPERDPETGRWAVTPGTGMVFALIPGGEFLMGSDPETDPHARSDETPRHHVRLAPFFLSKFEVTQAQWRRMTDSNPSYHVKPVRPVDNVSWFDCEHALRRHGLSLPSEAQWEYACRAGTSSPWWTGIEAASLTRAANVADRFASERGPKAWEYDDSLDDGAFLHTPVGTYAANRWGLHDLAGNVEEWCLDTFGQYSELVSPGTGERRTASGGFKISRGGSFRALPASARSAARTAGVPTKREDYLGVRPARSVTP